jgi:hypothetical protein
MEQLEPVNFRKVRDPFPPQADQPQAETMFARSGLLLADRIGRNCGIRVK